MKKSSIRIIGGRYRGRPIEVPDATEVRPTPNRVRETLFNWLAPHITGARCLDMFAGSGALGFEACSRGAQQVVMLEINPRTLEYLQKTRTALACPAMDILKTDALAYLQTHQDVFDIIFLDPPFADTQIIADIAAHLAHQHLVCDGLLYIESAALPVLDAQHWICLRQKKAGQVYYGLWQKSPEVYE